MSDLNILMEMGFSRSQAEKALSETGNKGIVEATEWLLIHEEDDAGGPVENSSKTDNVEHSEEKLCPKNSGDNTDKVVTNVDFSLETVIRQCDECGEKFRNATEVSLHAIKTGHSAFTQSSEQMESLTEEEEQQQLKELETIMKQVENESCSPNPAGKGNSQTEPEHMIAVNDSLERGSNQILPKTDVTDSITAGKPQCNGKAEQMPEFKRLLMQEEALRQSILQDIERDKQERRCKYGELPSEASAKESSPTSEERNEEYDNCRLQIRLTDGRTLIETFDPKEELAAVRLYIDLHRTDGSEPFTLMTNFPKRVFTDEDMSCSLSHLGLPPSAVIIATKNRQGSTGL